MPAMLARSGLLETPEEWPRTAAHCFSLFPRVFLHPTQSL